MTNSDTRFGSGAYHGAPARGRADEAAALSAPAADAAPRDGAPRAGRMKKAFLGTVSLAQIALTAITVLDIARRDPRRVNGPKAFWYSIAPLSWVGPIAWFLGGRRLGR